MKDTSLDVNTAGTATQDPEAAAPILIHRRRPRILVADDSAEIRKSLVKLLHGFNYDVSTASHGGQVLEMLFHQPFDLLLLDLNMPEMNGWETLDRIAVFKPELPVVVITAQPNQTDWVSQGGARALVEKPFDLPLLLQTIRDLIAAPKPSPASGVTPADPSRFRHIRGQRSGFTGRFRLWGINE